MESSMNITEARYLVDEDGNNCAVFCVIDGVMNSVPLAEGNRHYAEIMRQVDAGTLTIADAE
jgi:hypothetical protein